MPWFKNRLHGSYSLLIKNYLMTDEEILRKYCLLNKKQFNFIITFIYDEMRPETIRNAISLEEKLFLSSD